MNICKPFFQKFFREIKRVLEPENGFFYCFTDWRGVAFYMPLMEAEIGVRNLLVWDKICGAGCYYAFAYEMILFWCNNSKGVPAGGGQNVIRGYPGFSGGAKKTNGEKIHPTQKTLELISKLVQDSTEPGDLVLDPFLGSGTTGVACRNLGRDFIGYELQEKYYEVAKNRIFANCENPE